MSDSRGGDGGDVRIINLVNGLDAAAASKRYSMFRVESPRNRGSAEVEGRVHERTREDGASPRGRRRDLAGRAAQGRQRDAAIAGLCYGSEVRRLRLARRHRTSHPSAGDATLRVDVETGKDRGDRKRRALDVVGVDG